MTSRSLRYTMLSFAFAAGIALGCSSNNSSAGGTGGRSGNGGTQGTGGTQAAGGSGSGGTQGRGGAQGGAGAQGSGGKSSGGSGGEAASTGGVGGRGSGGGGSAGGAGGAGAGGSGGGAGRDASVGSGGSSGSGGTLVGGVDGGLGGRAGADGAANGGASGSSGGAGGGAACDKEDCFSSCTVPAMPVYSALTTNAKLPDPFMMMSGSRMTALGQWECRRAEIAAQIENWEMGQKNPKDPGTVTGSMSGNTLTVSVGGKSFSQSIAMPSSGSGPYPLLIYLDSLSLLDASTISGMGIATTAFNTNAMGSQGATATCGTSDRGKGFFFDVNGSDNGAGALIAWAWGVSRIIDAIEATPNSKIDPKKIAITGCSRNGKGALAIGAFDERIALTIPQESGSGGTASWRVSDAENSPSGGSDTVQTAHEIVGECVWFSTAFNQFSNSVTKLPYDHHALLGMVAPRGLFILENTSYQWLGVNSCVTDATAAQMVFQGLGVKDNIGFTNSAHTHCQFNTAEAPAVKAFLQKFLLGQSTSTANQWNITGTTFNGTGKTVDMTKWVDWTVPTLD